MLHLLGVVLVATRFGAGPAILAGLGGVAGLDFLLPPTFTFSVADMGHAITLGVTIFVSVLVSGLTEQLRRERQRAVRSEERTSALYALERHLAEGHDETELANAAVQQLQQTLQVEASVSLEASEAQPPADFALPGPQASLGVLHVEHAGELDRAEVEFVRAVAQRLAAALTRSKLSVDAETARLEAQVERVRAALLSSVSHDLRTPLASMSASLEMLLRTHSTMAPELRTEVLRGLAQETHRLDTLLRNLLAMTRLEAGKLEPRLLPAAVDEVMAGALQRVEARLADRQVSRSAGRGLPLVDADVVLLEQAIVNVLENAVRYSPPHSPLSITSRLNRGRVEVAIRDAGDGIPPDELEVVFEKFRRGSNAPRSDGGVGLGLTICRAIVQAHGGTVVLGSLSSGGTEATFSFPPSRVALREAEQHLPSPA